MIWLSLYLLLFMFGSFFPFVSTYRWYYFRGALPGRCDTLWTHSPLNGVQEVGGLPEGTSLRRRDPLAPTGQLLFLPQQNTMIFYVLTMYFLL